MIITLDTSTMSLNKKKKCLKEPKTEEISMSTGKKFLSKYRFIFAASE